MTTEETIWAAGFADGEACIYINAPRSTCPSITFEIGQTDVRPLLRFKVAVDEGKIMGPYLSPSAKKNHSPRYVFRVTGLAAQSVLRQIWPYLSDPKREQAADVLGRVNAVRAKRDLGLYTIAA